MIPMKWRVNFKRCAWMPYWATLRNKWTTDSSLHTCSSVWIADASVVVTWSVWIFGHSHFHTLPHHNKQPCVTTWLKFTHLGHVITKTEASPFPPPLFFFCQTVLHFENKHPPLKSLHVIIKCGCCGLGAARKKKKKKLQEALYSPPAHYHRLCSGVCLWAGLVFKREGDVNVSGSVSFKWRLSP